MLSSPQDILPKVAVLILNWNGEKLLPEFLPSVLKYTPKNLAEVIVADNGSTDCSLTLLEEQFPTVQRLVLDENHGFAGGYNAAIAKLKHPYIFLLNSDVALTEGWLEPLLDLFRSHSNCAAVMPKIRSYRRSSLFEYAGAAGGFLDPLAYPYCRGRLFDTIEEDHGQYDQLAEVFWTTGAAMLIPRQLFLDMGGFDDRFFAHQEEIDLCWRLRCKGYKLYCEPRSVVYHLGAASLSKENPRKTFLNFRNNLLMLFKNAPAEKRTFLLFLRAILDAMAALVFFFRGKANDARAVAKAWRAFWKMKEQDSPSSKIAVTEEEKIAAYKVLLNGRTRALLFSYHFFGKKYFSQL